MVVRHRTPLEIQKSGLSQRYKYGSCWHRDGIKSLGGALGSTQFVCTRGQSCTYLEEEKESNQLTVVQRSHFLPTSYYDNPDLSRAPYKSENGPERKLAQVLISLSQNTEMVPLQFHVSQISCPSLKMHQK